MSNTQDVLITGQWKPPDPAYAVQLGIVLRHLASAAAGSGLIGGAWLATVTDAQIAAIASGIMELVSIGLLVWAFIASRLEKRRRNRQDKASSVASAVASAQATHEAGQPVAVVVPPPPTVS